MLSVWLKDFWMRRSGRVPRSVFRLVKILGGWIDGTNYEDLSSRDLSLKMGGFMDRVGVICSAFNVE